MISSRGDPYRAYTGHLINSSIAADDADGTSADGDITFWELLEYVYSIALSHVPQMTPVRHWVKTYPK